MNINVQNISKLKKFIARYNLLMVTFSVLSKPQKEPFIIDGLRGVA